MRVSRFLALDGVGFGGESGRSRFGAWPLVPGSGGCPGVPARVPGGDCVGADGQKRVTGC